MMVEKVPDSTYDMVGGLDQQIKEIKEVIELPVKHPELFDALGIAQPKGVLLYGPPGTGKTLLARAVAHHTDCKFIRVSGSELVQKYIGEGSRMVSSRGTPSPSVLVTFGADRSLFARFPFLASPSCIAFHNQVRELFVMAREHAPSLIFMDEIDSIGSSRGESGSGGGDSEVQRTMLELLNQLDGFEATKNIKVGPCSPFLLSAFSPALLTWTPIDALPSLPSLSHRSSWPPTVSTSSTLLCYAPVALTGRSSSPLRDPRRGSAF